jgi:hypothetical protein
VQLSARTMQAPQSTPTAKGDRTFAAGSLALYCSHGAGVMIISYWFIATVVLSHQSITMLLFTELYYFPSFCALSYDNISIFFVNPLWYFLHISFQLLFSFAIYDQRSRLKSKDLVLSFCYRYTKIMVICSAIRIQLQVEDNTNDWANTMNDWVKSQKCPMKSEKL